jgi:predicted DNA-binding protein
MEVHFAPETEKRLKDLAAESGRGTADKLVQDVVEGYFDELAGLSQIGGVAPRAESCRRPVRQALLVNRVVTDC